MVTEQRFWHYLRDLISDRRGDVFFKTAERYIGTAPDGDIRIGDVVVVLVGGNVPFILRPVDLDNPGSYQMVGMCYV